MVLKDKKNKISKCEFIEKSNKIHNNKYDYSLVNFKGISFKINIICNIHGVFTQKASNHLLNKQGCAKCSGGIKRSIEDFIKKANFIHNNKYDYSMVDYKNNITDVIIICKSHGKFKQTPKSHLKGHGCNKCSNDIKKNTYSSNTLNFIEKAKKIHNDKYDYSLINYINNKKSVIIICKKHKKFYQNPNSHLNGSGCPKCNKSCKQNKTIFIKKANKIHNNKYDYSLVTYTGSYNNVKITCPIHKVFKQKPNLHLQGRGCRKCSIIISKSEKIWLDYIEKKNNIKILRQFKIPQTNYIADGYHEKTNTIYEFHGDYFHGNPNVFNKDDLNKKLNIKFGTLYEKTLCKENKIKELGYNLIVIWESDFKKLNINRI